MIFVTHNVHKFQEMRHIFNKRGLQLQWKNIEYLEIQGDTTDVISMQSCRDLAGKIEPPFFLEDTGIYIDALNGFPGPYSSYVIEKIGLNGILSLLSEDRGAEFVTVITLFDGKNFAQFTGTLRGRIAMEPEGNSGFGYDPIFIPDGFTKTLSEMMPEEKNTISHRYRAADKLISYLIENKIS